jgi:uncharacterized protein (DUF433 family)
MDGLVEPVAVLPLNDETLPLHADEHGTIRVGGSRVTFDLVIEQYQNGMSPEDMVRAYDTLQLADVHAAIAYYLRHRNEVLNYLTKRAQIADMLRGKIEATQGYVLREELLGRHCDKEKSNARAGQ